MKHPRRSVTAILLAGSTALCCAAGGANPPTLRELHIAQAKQQDSSRLQHCGSSSNFWLRPGLLADKTGRVVRVSAESLAITPGDPLEFPLITAGSGKDYEALALSFASALDIHEALQFIGLKPGRGVDASKLQFWPKGDRVKVTFHYADPSVPATTRHATAERLALDTRTQKPLPETGFVFTGSEWMPAMEPATGKVYAADAFSPGSIISIYNDSFSVLDVPRQAAQHEVYSFQVPNPDCRLPANQLIEVTLEPFYKDGLPHSAELMLAVAPAPAPTNMVFTLRENGRILVANKTLSGLLATFDTASQGGRDLFVTLSPAPDLPLAPLRAFAQFLSTVDNERGIHVEPPPEGHPYFRAFLPNEKFRKREDRPDRAAELHLTAATTGTLIWVDSEWKDDDTAPLFHETRVPVSSPGKLEAALAAEKDPPSVMLVFAPEGMPYGTLCGFMAPILKRNMILYVFL